MARMSKAEHERRKWMRAMAAEVITAFTSSEMDRVREEVKRDAAWGYRNQGARELLAILSEMEDSEIAWMVRHIHSVRGEGYVAFQYKGKHIFPLPSERA